MTFLWLSAHVQREEAGFQHQNPVLDSDASKCKTHLQSDSIDSENTWNTSVIFSASSLLDQRTDLARQDHVYTKVDLGGVTYNFYWGSKELIEL